MEFPSEHHEAALQSAAGSAILTNDSQVILSTFEERVIAHGLPERYERVTRAMDRLDTRTPAASNAGAAPLLMLEGGISPICYEQRGGAPAQSLDRPATRRATGAQRLQALLSMALAWYAHRHRTSSHRVGRSLQSAAALLVCLVVVIVMVLLSTTRVSEESVAPSVSVAAVPRPAPAALTSRSTDPDTASTARRASAPAVAAVAPQNASARTSLLAAPKLKRMNATSPGRRTSATPPPPIASHRSSLLVSSSPAGGEVFVNGVRVGATPILLRGLPSGSRVVRVDLDGYDRWSAAVRIVASKQTRVVAKLQRSFSR